MTLLRHVESSSSTSRQSLAFLEARSKVMEIVGIVMLSAVALYFVQQFQPGV